MNSTNNKHKIPNNLWDKLDESKKKSDAISRESMTYWQDAWRRLKKNCMAMIGLITILILVLLSIFYPMFSKYEFSDQNLDFTGLTPRVGLYRLDDDTYLHLANGLKVYTSTKRGELLELQEAIENDVFQKRKTYNIDGKNIIIDYSQKPFKLLKGSNQQELEYTGKKWNKKYIFGTDDLGRDILIRVVHGARISLTIAAVASLVNLFIGIFYGGISGYAGGKVDNIMMRIVDIINTVPLMLYVILLMVVLGSGLETIIITFGCVFWVRMARIVRGQILSLKKQEYVMAAKIIGASRWRILTKHLLPNTMGPIIVTMTLMIPRAIFTEAFLSFIGLGVSPPVASWGTLANDALGGLRSYPHQLFFPALAICVTMLAFNFLGDGLRDALDPKLRK